MDFRVELTDHWSAIPGVLKSNPSSINATILRRVFSAVSISRRSQSSGRLQPSRADGGQQHDKMSPRADVLKDHALEIAACNSREIEKHIVAVLRQVLEDRQGPRHIRPSITDEDGFFDVFHSAQLWPALRSFATL